MVDAALTDVGPSTSQERVTSYHFNPLGQMVHVSDPGGAVWSYSYDSFGNRTAATDPALGTWTTTFDANSNVTLQIDARNQRVELAYDVLNRISQKRVVAGSVTETTTFTYDQARTGYFNTGALTTTAVSTSAAGTYHVIESDVGNDGQARRVANIIDGRRYEQYINYRKNGAINNMRLPNQPGGSGIAWLPESFEYDAAGRMTKMSTFIPAITYNIWDQPLRMDYGSGAHESYAYDALRGWVHTMNLRSPTNALLDYTNYARSATGRVTRQTTPYDQGKLDYTYDYAGRLKTAQNWGADTSHSQVLSYTRAGSIAANSLVGTYAYPAAKHAPSSVTIGGVATSLTYDANGNMTQGLNGKVMAFDGENRVSSVTHAGKVTRYVYGADGSRLKMIENAGTAQQSVTVYFGMIEIRNWGQGAAEVVIATPHPSVRLINGQASYLYRDQLGSVRMVTDGTGARDQRKLYRAFGGETQWQHDATAITENRGFVGQHVDKDSGLQFLNARYFDQQLGLFVSADWLDVNQQGVGTNRYAYSGNDPVNRADPSGNAWIDRAFESVFGAGSFDRTFGAGASESMDRIADSLFGNSSDRQASSNYTSYSNNGGTLGYDAWRVGTGNFTGSLRNDRAAQGIGGNIVGGSVQEMGGFWRNLFGPKITTRNEITGLTIANPAFIAKHPTLGKIVNASGFFGFVLERLQASNYLSMDVNRRVEMTGAIYYSKSGSIRFVGHPVQPGAGPKGTPMPIPRPRPNETGVTFHTHPTDGGHPSGGNVASALSYGTKYGIGLGLVATYDGNVWGFDGQGYQ